LLLPATARAEAIARAVGAAPVRVILHLTEICVVEVLEAERTILFIAAHLETFLQVVSAFFVADQLLQNQSAA